MGRRLRRDAHENGCEIGCRLDTIGLKYRDERVEVGEVLPSFLVSDEAKVLPPEGCDAKRGFGAIDEPPRTTSRPRKKKATNKKTRTRPWAPSLSRAGATCLRAASPRATSHRPTSHPTRSARARTPASAKDSHYGGPVVTTGRPSFDVYPWTMCSPAPEEDDGRSSSTSSSPTRSVTF